MRKKLCVVGLVLLLSACGAEPAQTPLSPEQSAALKPKDARLAGLYDQSCRACHTIADSGAPLTGDRTQWDSRWAKGEAVLRANMVQGIKGMPAGGQCFACTPEDLWALTRFMAGQEGR